MSKTWLKYLNLSDEYERKARFLPAILALLPLLPMSIAYGVPLGEWMKILFVGLGIGAVVSVGISHLSSAFGNRLQRQLWPNWPHDSPTNQWLHPDDKTVSRQQKELWYKAIKRIVGLDIESSVQRQGPKETNAIINDAVKAIRDRLWRAPEAKRLRLHNIDYGFARNLTGLQPIWIVFAVGSSLGCWVGYLWYGKPLLWCIVSSLIAIAVFPLAFTILPGYVRQKADFYAESFFGALVAYDEDRRRSEA